MRPPIMFLAPGAVPRSMSKTFTRCSARRNAAAEPAGPAPTTMTSNVSLRSIAIYSAPLNESLDLHKFI